jgi:hypothetical protein
MTQGIGITNLKIIAESIGIVATAVHHVLADGKVNAQDLFVLPKLFPLLTKFSQLQMDKVLPEFKDLDTEEIKYLEQFFVENCQIPDAKIDALVESGFKAVMTVVAFLMAVNKGEPLQLSEVDVVEESV